MSAHEFGATDFDTLDVSQRVLKVELHQNAAIRVFSDQTKLLLSRFAGSRVAIGDEIAFPAPAGDEAGTEILITKHPVSDRNRYLYQAPIRYVTQPKPGKRT